MNHSTKAGSYGIQGYGSAFIKKINGSYSNIVGLPIHEVVELLKELEFLIGIKNSLFKFFECQMHAK
jgi:predicted house-cleaning NTP pyrophosphatase (Maf/HAM1 superfamily)